ncbi:MAG: PAS domain-containing protein [Thermoleophilia bacterium]|nr:PAS domain-containing protein [Thermoleophilia bacterium]
MGDPGGDGGEAPEEVARGASRGAPETVWREAPVGACELDNHGRCRAVNPAWSGMTGIAADRATGDGWMRCVHPDDRAAARARVAQAAAGGSPAAVPVRVVPRTGGGRWAELTVRPTGHGAGVVAMFVDTTDRVRREQELAAIAEHSPDAVLRLDANRRIVFANAAQARLAGFSPSAHAGRTVWELGLPEDLVVALDAAVGRALRTGRREDLEFPVPVGADSVWLHARVVPEPDEEGTVRHVLLVSRDVTERREAEDALRARDAMQSLLVRGVSHEFRAPLAAISAAADALERVPQEERRAELLGAITEETARLERLVANLLDLSRLEGGALVPRLDWCAVDELVTGARRASGVAFRPGELEVSLDPEHPLVRADQVLTERILSNLLRNAAIHGAPPVRVTSAEGDGVLQLAVEDSGAGLPEELRSTAFAPFVQGAGRPGIGVGLALARGLAEAQGGTLVAAPSPGGGARLVLSLPLVPMPEVPE